MAVTFLKEFILPAAFSSEGSNFVDCSLDSKYKGEDQFQSSVVFVTATVQVVEGNEKKKIPLVVKFEPFNEEIRNMLNTNLQFYNESLVYGQLIPLIDKNNICEDIFPKFYYGIGTIMNPEKNVIVIEDLRPKDFRMTKQKAYLEYEHLKIAMKKLANFHALSYIVKKEKPDEFYQLVGKLKETYWVNDVAAVIPTVQHAFHRACDPLIRSGRHSIVLQKLLSKIDESVCKFVLELVSPEEPTAVLCHGDFCRNNMLFKNDSSGTPVDVRFFDLATARYSSPVIDISFFLFMNSTKEVRAAHWDDLLTIYHESLSSSLGDIQGPLIQTLQQEMKLKAVYGFVHASFFLPMMLFENDFNMDDMASLTPEEVGLRNATIGGEEGTKLVMDMVEELINRGCLPLDHPL